MVKNNDTPFSVHCWNQCFSVCLVDVVIKEVDRKMSETQEPVRVNDALG